MCLFCGVFCSSDVRNVVSVFSAYLFIYFMGEVKSVIYLFQSYICLTKSHRMDHFKGAIRCCVLTNKRSYTNNVIMDRGSYWVRVALVGELGKLN